MAATHPRRVVRTARNVSSKGQTLNHGPQRIAPRLRRGTGPRLIPRPSGRRQNADSAGEGCGRGGWQPSGFRTGSTRSKSQAFLRLFLSGRVPVMSGGGEKEAGTAGVLRFSAAFVPPLEVVLTTLPASIACSRLGHSLAGPNSCLQRNLDAGSD